MEEYLLEIKQETVWVLVIEHRHGFNHYVNRTEDGMIETLANYCEEWWDETDIEEAMPIDFAERIDMYFSNIYEEWYTTDTAFIGP